MPTYWSKTPVDWRRSVPSVEWLGTDAPRGPLPYPPVLDMVESALDRQSTPLLEAAVAALAPRWEELGQAREPADSKREDSPEEEDDTEERLVLYGAALAISRIGRRFGCALTIGVNAEPNARYFATQLARLAEDTGFTLGCVSQVSALPSQMLSRCLARPLIRTVSPPATPLAELTSTDRRVLTVLAASRIGVPITAALRLGLGQEAADALAVPGPGCTGWIVLSRQARRRLRAGLEARDRCQHAVALFDAWPPDGWGYLRRAQLAVASGDRTRLRSQHAALFAGFAIIGRDLLQRHAAAVAATSAIDQDDSESARDHQIAAHLTAGRLASRLRPVTMANRKAVAHMGRARGLATDPVERLYLTYELANALAKQRTPESLMRARELYMGGLQDLAAIGEPVQQTRLKITLLNGLALVDYFQGADQAALELEERAERLAIELLEQEPDLARWALALIGPNTAKLLTVRFGDRRGAIAKLIAILPVVQEDSESSNKIRRDLARLHFAEGEYPEVIRMLDGLYPENQLVGIRPREEFHDRLILAVAQRIQGNVAASQAQLAQLRLLASREGSEMTSSVLSVLKVVP